MALLVLSLAWAWREVGLDYWQLVPRISMFLVVACIVATLYPRLEDSKGRSGSRGVRRLTLPLLLAMIVAGTIAGFNPHPGVAPLPGFQEALAAASSDTGESGNPDWPQYGQNVRGSRYSALSEINTSNVADLEVAWQYRTGDVPSGEAAFQGTPIKLGDMLYVCTPYSKVVAVDAETGEQKWTFDPKVKSKEWQRCRGLASWSEPADSVVQANGLCHTRIVLTTLDARLITLDAHSGAV